MSIQQLTLEGYGVIFTSAKLYNAKQRETKSWVTVVFRLHMIVVSTPPCNVNFYLSAQSLEHHYQMHAGDDGVLSRQTDYLLECQSGTQSSILTATLHIKRCLPLVTAGKLD